MTFALFDAARVAAAAAACLKNWTGRRDADSARLELLEGFAQACEGPVNLSVDDFALLQDRLGGRGRDA
jgi:hypothetical protein